MGGKFAPSPSSSFTPIAAGQQQLCIEQGLAVLSLSQWIGQDPILPGFKHARGAVTPKGKGQHHLVIVNSPARLQLKSI